ncbi:hypothetical protein V8F33_003185 [Rhypophila sp. PSN 637]
MAAVKTRRGGSRYSPPVSPRTISTEPTPNVAIEGDDYFLNQLDNHSGNKGYISPQQEQSSENGHGQPRDAPPSDRPRPPPLHLRTSHKSESKPRKLSDPRSHMLSPSNTKPLSAVSLDLRPLQELLNERSYLLYNLQKQDERATSLFRRYATLEARLAESQTAKEARKIRKDAKLVKYKITESTQQEQLIFLRLGEIYIETQNRERWMQFRYPQSATFQRSAYFPPLFYGTGDEAISPAPPPSAQGSTQHHYPLTPYINAQTSPAFSYLNSSSALSPFSPDFVPGVTFHEDIWNRPGLSPHPSVPQQQHSRQNQNQNFYRIDPDARPSIESRTGLNRGVPEIDEEYDENKWHQEEEDDPHPVVPWHQLRHDAERTTTPPRNGHASSSEDTQVEAETPATATTTMTGEDSENDEETRIFKNYLRAVSHGDVLSPSEFSPHNCFNWVSPGDCAGGGGAGAEAAENKARRMKSLPSLRNGWAAAGGKRDDGHT